MVNMSKFFFLSTVLTFYLFRTQNNVIANTTTKLAKEQNLPFIKRAYDSPHVEQHETVKLKNVNYKNIVKNIFRSKKKIIKKRSINFVSLNVPKTLELKFNDPISLISNIYSKEKTKFLSSCYEDNKVKKVDNCDRFTLSEQICDAPIEFNPSNNFSIKEENELSPKCLVDNKAEYRMKSNHHIVLESGELFDLKIKNENSFLRTSVIITKDICINKVKLVSPYFLFKKSFNTFGSPILYRGEIIGSTFKNIKVQDVNVEGLFNVCSCYVDYTYYYYNKCSRANSHYTTVSTIRVIQKQKNEIHILTGNELDVNLEKYVTPFPIKKAFIIKNIKGYTCNNIHNKSFNEIQQDFYNNEKKLHLYNVFMYETDSKTFKENIIFQKPGTYLLCYSSSDNGTGYSALLSTISVNGYDMSKIHYLYLDLYSSKLALGHSVILYRYNLNESLDEIYFKKKQVDSCSGEHVIYSNKISNIPRDKNADIYLDTIYISDIYLNEYDGILEICSKKKDKYSLIGYAMAKPYILHNQSDVNHLLDFDLAPDDIRTYVMQKESYFFIFFPELLEIFRTHNINDIYISFLCYSSRNEIILTYNFDKNMTPSFFTYFKISSPSSSILHVTKDEAKLYVLKKNIQTLYLYDITPEKVNNKRTIMKNNLNEPYVEHILSYYLDYADVIKCENCLSPIMMEPIYDENKNLKYIFLMTSHPYNKFLIVDLNFEIIYMHNSNVVKNAILTIRGLIFTLDVLKDSSLLINDISCGVLKNEFLDCFLIDQLNNTVIAIEYIKNQNALILIDTFQAENKNDENDENIKPYDFVYGHSNIYLQKPQNVLVYPYGESYVIFINEGDSNEINLLLYDKSKPNSNFTYITKINNTYMDHGKIERMYKFYDCKELINRNMLLIVKYYEGDVQFIYVPIRSMSNKLQLNYNYPSVIQDNQEEYVLKVKSHEIKKMNLLHNFQIDVHNVDKSQHVTIDKHDGTVKIKLSEFVGDPVNFTTKRYGAFTELSININFTVICADGMKVLNGKCVPCSLGSYNNIGEYIKHKNMYECTMCQNNSTTKNEASVSITQCLCLPGYELNNNDECVPCKRGTWKTDISNIPCIFHCYPNSYSTIQGSRSEEESECRCKEGYYFVSKDSTNVCEPCDVGHFCPGGYKANKIKCPENTTNIVQQKFSIKSCKCDAGFETFDSSNINNYNFKNNPIFDNYKDFIQVIESSQVCVPCKKGFYKNTVSAEKCKSCSAHVSTDAIKSTSISDCNKCDKGYYLHKQDSCLLCPNNHYCPGSGIVDPKYAIYENEKVPCNDKSLTEHPNELNVSQLSCLCKKGFEFVRTEDNEFDCSEVPKNYYKSKLSNTQKNACPVNSITLHTQTKSKEKCICMAGFYWDITEYKCIKCPKGYYCPGGNLENCFKVRALHLCKPQKTKCPIKNSTTQTEESFSESSCLCDKGYTINKEALGECVQCPVNTYKDVISNAECTMCLTPYTTEGQLGSTKEEDCTCSGGYYFFNHCLPCSDKNTYCKGGKMIVNNKSKTFHYAPSKCPPNTVVSFEAERPYNQSFCVCKKGYKHVYTANDFTKICAPCERGFFKTIIGDFTCESKCKPNSTSFPGTMHDTHCFCLENYYFKNGICLNCPDGAYCEGGFEEESILSMKKNENYLDSSKIKHIMPVPKENYALYKLKTNVYNADWFIVECPIKEACLYNEKCHESMTNFLCGECKKGYTNNFSKLNLCIKCSGNLMNILHMIFVNIFVLLFTVIMAYLNVFTGANRKSVHSIVIKIAVNYFSCMKIFYIMGTSEIYFPLNFSSHINYIIESVKRLLKAKKNYGLYCILTSYFNLSHSDAYFYGMVYYAFKPIILAIILTILMFLVVQIYKFKVKNETKIKLNVIGKIKELGHNQLYEEIMHELPSERALVLFRYIPIPGDSKFKRIRNFLEDMIPMYVTLLFFIHTKTTYSMLTLLDCKAIYYNDKFVEQYMSYVPSVKCDLSKSYAKFFILGITGTVVWGIGIPLMSYLVLYKNRKHLHSESILFKYGFLNNGFNFQFWYWESIVFLRKILVLLISSVPVFKTARIFGTTMWLFIIISSLFLTLQMILQPFDSRNYHILNKLETYSMVAWTITLMIFVFLTVSNATATTNFYVLLFLLFFNFIFIAKVLVSLCHSYIENLRHIKKMIKFPYLRKLFDKMSKIAEEKYYKEPIVSFNTHNNSIQFTRKYRSLLFRNHVLTNEEKNYFLHVLSNFIYFGVLNLNFTVFHSYFMEFMLRLSIIDNTVLHKKGKSGVLKLIAKDPKNIDEWIKIKECELNKRTFFERHKKILNLFTKKFFIIQSNIKRIIYKGDKHTIISDYEVLINVLKYDEDFITDFKFLYDEEAVRSGLILSDLQLSFTKFKMKDKKLIMQLFSLFVAKKNIVQFERDVQLKNKIEQLQSLYEILIKASEKKKLTFRKNVEDAILGDPYDYRTLENELSILNDRINNLIDNYQRLKDINYYEDEHNSNDKTVLNNDSELFDTNLIELSFKEINNDTHIMGNDLERDEKRNKENTENDDKTEYKEFSEKIEKDLCTQKAMENTKNNDEEKENQKEG
ncbi:cysteine repeat modular protein 2, putative [Plasmodium malariae]|uniref:Cysteine repeat modular protein 2, putative n=1 Tax=Plasmodium malariae TaxID=5858 RepID=A0A1D3JII6_PLAMA|nr:cysteine repeat modular protein 2, putative [Plasmodium malariae]SBT86291.1 cysteine repeat modular protein 2, putative [Plasmodium malariae]